MTDKDDSIQKRLKESEWIVICSLWERGEVTLKELSEKFGVSDAALSQGLKRRGIKRGAKAHIAYKEIAAKHKAEREKLLQEVYDMKRKFIRYGDFLMNLTMNEITEAKKGSKKMSEARIDIETLYAATKVYKAIRHDMFYLYELYDKNKETDLKEEDLQYNIGIYSKKELDELKDAQELFAKEWAEKQAKFLEDEKDDSDS